MEKTALRYAKTDSMVSLSILERYAEGWLLDGEIRQHSPQTLTTRRIIVSKLIWFLKRKGYQECGTLEIRQFLAYLNRGHEEPGGRFGNPQLTNLVRPRTVKDYHSHLRTFFRWLVLEGAIDACPLDSIAAPISRADQVQPFAEAQINSMLQAARRSRHPRRDEAVVMFLLDTGVRVSELATLCLSNIDLTGKRAVVLGKGNKRRTVYFGRATTKALWQYLNEDEREPDSPLFLSEKDPKGGKRPGNARAETLFSTPMFRASARDRRCRIPADGFYEWIGEPGSKKLVPFTVGDGEIFAFAGIWDQTPDGQQTCAIVTTEPNDLVRTIHDRMRVILAPEDYDIWLGKDTSTAELQSLLLPCPCDWMQCGEAVHPKELAAYY